MVNNLATIGGILWIFIYAQPWMGSLIHYLLAINGK